MVVGVEVISHLRELGVQEHEHVVHTVAEVAVDERRAFTSESLKVLTLASTAAGYLAPSRDG